MNVHQKALDWATEYLNKYKGYNTTNHKCIINTPYSTVHRFETEKGIFYLKQTPKLLYQEVRILNYLNEKGCAHIPEIIAYNDNLHCFIMPACGDEPLRTIFKGKVDVDLLGLGLANFTKIQRSVENKHQQLLSFDIPDWKLEAFPNIYKNLIEQDDLLKEDGITTEELERLHQLYDVCVTLCENLSEFKISETLCHNDFHENNMLLDRAMGNVNIIDWGEVILSHPFFSLNGFLWNITYFNDVLVNDITYQKLQLKCVEAWLDLHDEIDLIKALTIANKLSGIYAALGYERLYTATQDQAITVQQPHPGSIAGCLRTFLDAN